MDIQRKFTTFVQWWLAGLLKTIPERIQGKIFLTPDRLIVSEKDDTVDISLTSGNSNTVLETKSITLTDELQKSDMIRWLTGLKNKTIQILLAIPENELLKKTISLPAASEPEIHAVLGFEMDKQTPFTVDQVYYDCQVIRRDKINKLITVALYVTPRKKLEKILDKISTIQLSPELVSVYSNNELQTDINLLPDNLTIKTKKSLGAFNMGLMVTTLLLFLTALYGPLMVKSNQLSELEAEVDNYRQQAMSAQPIIKERDEILSRTRFLDEKVQSNKEMIKVISELSRLLPDNTWLSRLIIRNGEIQIHGESDTAIAIIQLIEDSPMFNDAQFRSPVTQNNITRKDKFHVSAVIQKEGAS